MKTKIASVFILLIFIYSLKAQVVSSTSLALNRALVESSYIPKPQEIIVEEYINYYRHNISMPSNAEEDVAMEIRFGNSKLYSNQNQVIMQIGLITKNVENLSEAPTLNLALVIDRSGSMAGEKMEKVKESLVELLEKLRKGDILSVIVFSSEAEILVEAQKIDSKLIINQRILNILPYGSTNIHDGLMMGYNEVMKNFNENYNNRVILLTDGRTNEGVTDHELIITRSSEYNRNNISLSVIGLGNDLDFILLRQLAKAGKGLIHFIDNNNDIKTVFDKEIQSLFQPIAKNVMLEIECDSKLSVEQIFGYQPYINNNKIVMELDNMNSGLTQVVIIKFAMNDTSENEKLKIKTKLTYFDFKSKKNKKISITGKLIYEKKIKPADYNWLHDSEIKKNYTIANTTLKLKSMAEAFHKQDVNTARNIVKATYAEFNRLYTSNKDSDLQHIYNILKIYYTLFTE